MATNTDTDYESPKERSARMGAAAIKSDSSVFTQTELKLLDEGTEVGRATLRSIRELRHRRGITSRKS